jgi:hypothetical protein
MAMRAIFISYRRDDSEGQAGRLYDDLSRTFGNSSVFMDVAAIEPGLDFRKVIDHNVASCGVLLALIGPTWLDSKDESGQRRLDNPMDFVRLETASALKRDIPVVPVLVHGAKMPKPEQLPEDLRELAYRNGLELTHTRWDSDIEILVKALQRHVKGEDAASPELSRAEPPRSTVVASAPQMVPRKSHRGLIVSLMVAVGVVFALYGWVHSTSTAAKQPVTITTTLPVQQQSSTPVTNAPSQKAQSQTTPAERNSVVRTVAPKSSRPIVPASQNNIDVADQDSDPLASAANAGPVQPAIVNGGSKVVESSPAVTRVPASSAVTTSSTVSPPPPMPSAVSPPMGSGISARNINPNVQAFAVVHYGGATAEQMCAGWLTIDGSFVRYRAIKGTHGVHSFDFPVGQIKEVKKNAMVLSAYQAFHIRMQNGEVFNFSQVDPTSVQFMNPDRLISAVHMLAQR